jgi:hypothetical protein
MLKDYWLVAALTLIAMLSVPAAGQTPPSWVHTGMLTCKLNPSIGFIVAGHQSMECRFVQSAPFPPEDYQGALNTVGIDIGITAGDVLGWTVYASTIGIPVGALTGEYVGASRDISLGVGVGANILVGGSGRTIALQPISLKGPVAINVAVGASGLQLRPAY